MGWVGPRALDEADKIDRKQAGRLVRRTMALCRPIRREVAGGLMLMVLHVVSLVAGPWLFSYAIDRGLGGRGDGAALDIAAIGLIACAITAFVCSRAYLLIVTRAGEKFLRSMRTRVFDHMLGMSLGFFDTTQTGQLVSRMTSDVDSLSDLVQLGLVQFALNGLLFVATVIALLILSPLMAAVCLVAVPIVAAASHWFRKRSNAAYLLVRDRIGQMLSTLQEGLTGVRVVQAFNREEMQIRRFGATNDAQLEANMAATKISSIYFPFIEGSGVLTTAAVVGIGGLLVHDHDIQVGIVAAFILYLTNLFEPISQLSQLFNLVQAAGAALTKLFTLMDTPSPVVERPGAIDLPADDGRIEFDDVTFGYNPAEIVLSDVTLSIANAERIAFVGPTGAGKSTLAKLASRFYDPTRGAIRVGGVDLRDARLDSIHHRIIVVPQEGHLFAGSVAENVRLGRSSATDEDVAAALDAIGALDRFAAMPEGLDTDVREGGSRLSAGERQLVSLARAFLADPRVLILDEATSNLDPGSEIEVERALDALMRGRTVIIVAHRLSTAERSDRVAVIAAGGIAEVGTHTDLVARGGRYAALFASWTGGFSAARDSG